MFMVARVAIIITGVGSAAAKAKSISDSSIPDFDETLIVRPLADGGALLFANFTLHVGTRWRTLDRFPRPLAEIALTTDARNVQLSLSSGGWLSDVWGSAPDPATTGIALSAQVPPTTSAARWHRVSAALDTLMGAGIGRLGAMRHGALVCIGRVDSGAGTRQAGSCSGHCARNEQRPAMDLRATAAMASKWKDSAKRSDQLYWYAAYDAREGMSIDQISRLLHLMPCGMAVGVGALFRRALGDAWGRRARYMGLQLRLHVHSWRSGGMRQASGMKRDLVAHFSLTLVLPRRRLRVTKNNSAVPSSRMRESGHDGNAWLDELLSSAYIAACPFAQKSRIILEMLSRQSLQSGQWRPSEPSRAIDDFSHASKALIRFDLPANAARAIMSRPDRLRWQRNGAENEAEHVIGQTTAEVLTLRRVLGGAGDRVGTLHLEIVSSYSQPMHLVCRDALSAWLAVQWHSIKAISASQMTGHTAALLNRSQFTPGTLISPLQVLTPSAHTRRFDSPERGASGAEGFGVGVEVGSGHMLLWEATLPPHSGLSVSVDFDKPLQHLEALLKDAARGLVVGSASLTAELRDGNGDFVRHRFYADALAVPLPVIDASMPFNVLSISGTLVALFVGSMFTLLVRRQVLSAGAWHFQSSPACSCWRGAWPQT